MIVNGSQTCLQITFTREIPSILKVYSSPRDCDLIVLGMTCALEVLKKPLVILIHRLVWE